MGVNELMIGNIVGYSSLTRMVTAINPPYFIDLGNSERTTITNVCIEHLNPIPITEEFLEKNGFKVDEVITKLCDENYYAKGIDECAITIHQGSNTIGREWGIHIDNDSCCTIAAADIQYVHQLQNLLNIMNIKFDIVL